MRTLAIVVSYNDVKNTLRCVESLHDQTRVVVWDNASTDRTVHELTHRYPDVEILASNDNVLWTPALNQAMKLAYDGEDLILFSNNDIVYAYDTIDKLATAFDTPGAGIAAPAGAGLGGQQDFVSHRPCPDGISFDYWVSQQPTVRAAYVVGAAFMVSRDCWNDVGEFDDRMPLGADDHDYCIRAKAKGWSIWVVNSAYVHHQSHASYRWNTKEIWKTHGEQSWDAFNRKWGGYFHDEEEATKAHWGDRYNPGWEIGTGWLSEEERAKVYEKRNAT